MDQPTPPNENIIYLYNTHDFAFWGFLQEARAQLRFNVPPALQVPGVSYRGRVLEVFYADSDPTYTPQVVKIHEVEMKAGQWQSPVITPVMRPEDGETDLQAFSVVAEPIQPRPILSLPSSNPSADTAPPEYQKTRPTITSQDLVAAGAGTRKVLMGSLTLQQINLSDSSGTLAQWPGATATWSVLPGATAQVRLWRWTDDATPLGTWTLVGPNDNLAAYFGSKTNYIFAEALGSGRATVRITLTLGGQVVHDDIEVQSGIDAELAVDANRDGVIRLSSEDTTDAVSVAKPYRFWVNDDFDGYGDAGPPATDAIPDSSRDAVAGVNDLKDFFPVFLDIKQLVTVIPPGSGVTYKLKQADSALKFLYTSLTRPTAYSYKNNGVLYGSTNTFQITADGVPLVASFLNDIKSGDQGVLLMEGTTATNQPLVLTVEKDGATIAEYSLPLSLGQDIVLLLHGMNSNTDTWSTFVNVAFPQTAHGLGYTDINNREFQGPVPPRNSSGVRCYRLQFGFYDAASTREGLEHLISTTAEGGIGPNLWPYLSRPTLKCGDFETFAELGQEIDDAIALLLTRHSNAHVVLVAHSRGGLAARTFLETPGSSSQKSAVVGLLTTSSLHLGSRMGRVYQWLEDHPRGAPGSFSDDWGAVDFLRSPTAYFNSTLTQKDTLDVRRPVIMDMSDRSAAIQALDAPSAVARLPAGIRYGEIIYEKVDLGILTLGLTSYSTFDRRFRWDLGEQLSDAAKTYILGEGNTPATFAGDGLIPAENQVFTQLAGFPAPALGTGTNKIPRLIVTNREVVHTGAPNQFEDMLFQLQLLVPGWFPP